MRLKIHESSIVVIRESDVILITGDGKTLPWDMEIFLSWKIPHDVMAIGRSINIYPGKVLHWANVDSAESIWWAENLPPKNGGGKPIRHTLGSQRGFDVDWDIVDEIIWNPEEVLWHGSTALFAVYASLALGYQKIILAGCPLDNKGHWYFPEENKGPRWTPETYQAFLEFAKDPEAFKVRSLSGYTKQIVGEATEGWIHE